MLLVPLVTGASLGLLAGGRAVPLISLTAATLALFWLRTPVESWLGTTPIIAQPGRELQLVRRTALALSIVSAFALFSVFRGGANGQLWGFGATAALAFAAQAYLKKRWRPARIPGQILGAAGLSATAPAAYFVATGEWTSTAGALWAANLLFAINQIHFVQLRIHSCRAMTRAEKLAAGRGFLAGQACLVLLIGGLCQFHFLNCYAALAFIPVLLRGFAWFVSGPTPLAIRKLGWSELGYAALFGALLVAGMQLR